MPFRFDLPLYCSTVLIALVGAALPSISCAQTVPEPQADGWKFTAGAAVVSHPKYPGSDQHETLLAPMLSAEYGRFFIGGLPSSGAPAGVGMNLLRDEHVQLGIGLSADLRKPRKESDDAARLYGLGDVGSTEHASLFGSYRGAGWVVRGNVMTDIGGKHEGTTASVDAEAFMPIGRVTLSAGPGVTWANSSYTRTFFGIDAAQSAASGRAEYAASSGIEALRFGIGANYGLTPRWSIGTRFVVERLQGDAADSPITSQRTPKTVVVFTGYRF